jgi:holo-[acyl-carrier protein] synthase
MIAGTGIDIVEVRRLGDKVKGSVAFRDKVFSADEIAYCNSNASSDEHYAARFAAKEAFLKAAGTGFHLTFELNEIEIVTDTLGKPSIRLLNQLADHAMREGWKAIHVSMSHVKDTACAMVIIEK